ncbi:MAG TPA: phosphatidylglycerophosphate synthase [Lachnospiraceae bacterium]|nr:phosphatidylglycerophosphate synthase [Lachnospiraceae bacterium]
MEQKTDRHSKYEKKIITIPNMLSFFRICLIPVIVWLYSVEQNYMWAGYILILSGITDMVDGYIARHFHMVSNLGKILDPIADKLTQGVMLMCLVLRFPLMIVPFILLIAKEIYMSVSGILVIQRTGIVCGADWHGKAATCVLYGTMFLHVFWHEITPVVSMVSIIACAALIGVSFVLYGIRNAKLLKNSIQKQEGGLCE